MIRIAIRAWAFCFASLTILPGCQILSPFAGTTSGVAKEERVQRPPLESAKQDGPAKPNEAVPEPKVGGKAALDPHVEQSMRVEASDKQPASDPPSPVQTVGRDTSENPAAAQAAPPMTLPMTLDGNKDKREYAPLVKALQCIFDERYEEGIEHLNRYDKRTQEFLIGLLPIMNIFMRKGLDEMSSQEVAVLNNQLVSLLTALRPRSELAIAKMCYCKQVRGFGAYDVLAGNHEFLSATADRPGELVQLYVELKNFTSEAGKDGEFLTKLACSLDLQNAKGETVYSLTYDRKETTHRRRTRLNDFHSNYTFYVPRLAPGEYKLTMRIVDETVPGHPREVSKSLSFRATPVWNQALR